MEDLPAKPQPKDPYAQARALGREFARAANVPQAKRKASGPKGKRGGARPGAGAPRGNSNAKGHKRPAGAGRKAVVPGDPRHIKINVAINNAEAAALDAKAAAAGLTRLDMIRALISM